MSRYLFVVPPFPSHVYPTVSVGQELVRRGHDVAWVTYAEMGPALPEGARFFPLAMPVARSVAEEIQRQCGAPWLVGVKAFFQDLVAPLAQDMLPGVEAAIADFRPDALIVDQMALAGALAARRQGLPWATSATSCALIEDSFAPFPKVEAWITSLYESLQREAGLVPVQWPDRSPDLVLLYTSRTFAGDAMAFPDHYRFCGPALDGRQESVAFPWDDLSAGPRIFVSLGSLFAFRGSRFYQVVAEALADAPVQVIVSAPEGAIPEPPANFIVRPWVPVVQLLPKLDALVTHAGTTLTEGLLHGLPSVAAPIVQDQGIMAQRAAQAGAAVRVSFTRVKAFEMRRAVFEVLENPSYRIAAKRLQASFLEAGGAPAAAAAIESFHLSDCS